MINYYFDTNGIYTHKLPASPNTLTPDNALRVAPVFPAFNDKFQPILNKFKNAWIQIEDHRQQKDKQDRIIEGTGTPYYLPEDNYKSEARYMRELGKLPQNALLLKPEKTFAEAKVIALAKIKRRAKQEEANGHVLSSLGFKINASRKSKEDVEDIIQSMINSKTNSIDFRDYDNKFHALSLEQVKVLKVDIINKALSIYQHKWDLQALIANAKTLANIEAIVW